MKLYFAGATSGDLQILKNMGVKRFLISYYYMNERVWEQYKDMEDLFLDSGAFSAFTKKRVIDLDKYIEFIKEKDIKTYAGLDVIRDAEASKKNIDYMLTHDLDPIPTFHKGSKFDFLYEILNQDFNYIALGGMAGVDTSVDQNKMWLDRVWRVILKEKPDLKVHGFACTSFDVMKAYPWYSVDSTTWNVCRKFGEGYSMHNGEMKRRKKSELYEMYIEHIEDLGEYVQMGDFLIKTCVEALLQFEGGAKETKLRDNIGQLDFFE
jgi:hypothetical protein